MSAKSPLAVGSPDRSVTPRLVAVRLCARHPISIESRSPSTHVYDDRLTALKIRVAEIVPISSPSAPTVVFNAAE